MPESKGKGEKFKEILHIHKGMHSGRPRLTLGQRAADNVTKWAGSWTFIIILFVIMAIWICLNMYLVLTLRWDPYPFILLNFVLSTLAAVQAPVILMSQNRAADRDRAKLERDFTINRKEEKELEKIQKQLREINRLLNKR